MVIDVTLSMPVPPRWTGASEDHFPNKLRLFLRDHLRNEASKGEAKQVDLLQAHGTNKRNRVSCHSGHRIGRRTF